MSKMSELDLCIQDASQGDEELRQRIVDEMELHLNGLLPYSEMSERAQLAICMFEAENQREISYHEGHLGAPVDIDDIPLEEGE